MRKGLSIAAAILMSLTLTACNSLGASSNFEATLSAETDEYCSPFGDSGLELELVFWADQSWDINNYKSEIRFEIDRLFREYEIKIPYPKRDILMNSDKENLIEK